LGNEEPTAPKGDVLQCSCGQSDDPGHLLRENELIIEEIKMMQFSTRKTKSKLDFYAKIKLF
jgi:hypothetical protein